MAGKQGEEHESSCHHCLGLLFSLPDSPVPLVLRPNLLQYASGVRYEIMATWRATPRPAVGGRLSK